MASLPEKRSLRDELTSRLLVDVRAHYGLVKTPEISRIDPYQHPYSQTLRVELTTEQGVRTHYIKIPSVTQGNETVLKRRLTDEYNTLQTLTELFGKHESLFVVKPIALYPDLLALVTEAAHGPTLQKILSSDTKWYRIGKSKERMVEYVGLSADWLRHFHAATGKGCEQFDAESLRDYCDVRLARMVAHPSGRVDESLRRTVCSYIKNVASTIPQDQNFIAHRHNDFAPHNMIVNETGLHVLDFSMVDLGPTCFDVANFWHRLDVLKTSRLHSAALVSELQRLFLTRYGRFEPSTPLIVLARLRYTTASMWAFLENEGGGSVMRLFRGRQYARYLKWLRQTVAR